MKLAKAVRIATIPQLMALVLLSVLYFTDRSCFASLSHYLLGILFLAVFPMLGYPITWLFFKKRDKRQTERTLAIILCLIGYAAGVLMAFLGGGTDTEKILFLTYLLSGAITAALSFGFKFKSSGHTCGIAGPIAMLVYARSAAWLAGAAVLAAAYISSLKLRRHTLSQLIAGTLVPLAAFAGSLVIAA